MSDFFSGDATKQLISLISFGGGENNRTVDHWLFAALYSYFQPLFVPPIHSVVCILLVYCFHVQCVGSIVPVLSQTIVPY